MSLSEHRELFQRPQYLNDKERPNFWTILVSGPDRWVVAGWRGMGVNMEISRREQEAMTPAFRAVE